ncbi:hypothetical protein [Nocardioides sp.]|uniref:hypothetical protein n=1 Tax=Nocardioides sp. TaxID=35761 RepID=UPI002B278A09|nr:hypothetical protein [Nocardioides sp.]
MPRTPRLGLLVAALLLPWLPLAAAPSVLPTAAAAHHVEDYASYQPATKCRPNAKPGTEELGHWLVKRFGGRFGGISRACGGSTSEHTEGRAFDWTVNASTKTGRKAARQFLRRAFKTNRAGETDALARRMGIMYVIWDDQMYSAWRGFEPVPYLSSGCKKLKKCSQTLRHRDHVHISLTRQAARGKTSWYFR